MWVGVSVLYLGKLATYDIAQLSNGSFVARLKGYKGDSAPPHEVNFRCEGRHCSGSVVDSAFLDDLYLAYQHERKHHHT